MSFLTENVKFRFRRNLPDNTNSSFLAAPLMFRNPQNLTGRSINFDVSTSYQVRKSHAFALFPGSV